MLVYLQGIWQRLVKNWKTGALENSVELCTVYIVHRRTLYTEKKRVNVEEKQNENSLENEREIKDDANIKESGSLTRTASKTNREILFADRCSAKSAIARHCTVETTKVQFSALHRLVVDIVTALLSSSLHCTGY